MRPPTKAATTIRTANANPVLTFGIGFLFYFLITSPVYLMLLTPATYSDYGIRLTESMSLPITYDFSVCRPETIISSCLADVRSRVNTTVPGATFFVF